MKNKIYALVEEDYFYGEQHNNFYLFDTKEKAKEELKRKRDWFIESNNVNEERFVIDADCEDEYDVYENGNYNTNRYVLYISEKEIMK